MMVGPTPPPDGGQHARNSMEGSDSSFVFGLAALAIIVFALMAWLYLAGPDDEPLPTESVVVTTTIP